MHCSFPIHSYCVVLDVSKGGRGRGEGEGWKRNCYGVSLVVSKGKGAMGRFTEKVNMDKLTKKLIWINATISPLIRS